jgi:MFS family permease
VTTGSLDANLVWYVRHQRLAGALFWMPSVVLYLIAQVGLARALQIQAVYYVAVVVAEVPSGWLSDRFGRVLTLRLAAALWIAAHGLFLVGEVPALIAAQVLLAAGYACLSGTDVTFHFDTLESLGRADDFDALEARARRGLLLVTAATALMGGGLAFVDLRLPFVAALAASVLQLGCTAALVEPPNSSGPTGRFLSDVAEAAGRLRDPVLAWLAAFVAAQVIVVHLVAELAGPYLAAVFDQPVEAPERAALVVGIVAAVAATLSAGALVVLRPAIDRIGLTPTLLGALLVPVLALAAMATASTIWIVPLLALRGVPGAVMAVLAPSVVGGRVERHRRATFLSLTSLGGRLGYAAVLVALGVAVADTDGALGTSLVVGLSAWLAVAFGRLLVPRFPTQVEHVHEHIHPAVSHAHLHVHDDDHHGHRHDPPVVGPHSHPHDHAPVRHRHRHTRDEHHHHEHTDDEPTSG